MSALFSMLVGEQCFYQGKVRCLSFLIKNNTYIMSLAILCAYFCKPVSTQTPPVRPRVKESNPEGQVLYFETK